MITIWDLHHDEYKRLDFFIGNTTRYRGPTCPETRKLVVSEGSSGQIPPDQIPHTVLYPCIRNPNFLIAKGYKYAFTKDEAQRKYFGDNGLTLPPVFQPIPPEQKRTMLACSMIHLLQQRDKPAYQFIKKLGIINYGQPNNPCVDTEKLPTVKFLVHPKTIGYLCNAVIKATNCLTPVIFTEESYRFGYGDFLRPGVSCIVVKNEREARKAMQMSEASYKRMQEEIAASVERVRNSYDDIRLKTADFIKKVWPD